MNYRVLYIVFSLLIISCSDEYDDNWNYIDNFPPPVILEGKRIMENEFANIDIYTVQSHIIISTMRDTLFHVYDKNLEYLGSFGNRGRGPYEFPQVALIRDAISYDDTLIVFAIDLASNKKYGIDLLETLVSGEMKVFNEHELHWDLYGAYFFYTIDEEMIVGTYRDQFYQRLDGNYGLFYYNPGNDSVVTVPLHNLDILTNEGLPVNDPSARMNINSHASAISPDRSKIATIMFYTPRLEVFHIGEHSSSQLYLKPENVNEKYDLDTFYRGDITVYYNDIHVTDEYIYFLYSGHKEAEDEIRSLEKIIQVIDWNGNPHRQYIIPSRYDITVFTVDEDNGHIYGLSHPKDAIYKFPFQ